MVKRLVIALIIIIIILLGIIVYINIGNKKVNSDEGQDEVKTEETKTYDEYGRLNPLDPYYELVEENKNYKVYTDESGFNCFYNVYNNNGELIDTGFNIQRGVGFETIGDILNVRIGFGTYAFICRYYDLSTNRISRFYTTPLEIGGEYIAYFISKTKNDKDEIVLVIQNIFDEQVYYKEIKRNFSSRVLGFYSETEFINNNTQLKISYSTNPDDEIITEIIDL